MTKCSDVVMDVKLLDDAILRFDLLSRRMPCAPTYASKTYHLLSNENFAGIFDFFDDFFKRRIDFFYSSRNVQRFLMSIDAAEEAFGILTEADFGEYCSLINDFAVKGVNLRDSLINPRFDAIERGYGIVDESSYSYKMKVEAVSKLNYNDIIANTIKLTFDQGMAATDGRFVCVYTLDNRNPSFYMENSVNMPILFNYSAFAKSYIDNLVIPLVKHGIFTDGATPVVKIVKLDDDMTLDELLSIYDEDGHINTKDITEIGRVENTIEFTDEYIKNKRLSSIISH